MERALAASAIAEHAAHCSGSLQGRVLCKESHLPLRRIKEALFIRHNTNINRDNGVDISAIWGNIINATKCCLIELHAHFTLHETHVKQNLTIR
ncbi:hypothetical protein M513_12341 [Trichuris suis]|uniref:Uncharacterized protein n=1 Tax=Trichuris suis TaxID=68888 RepID=A0A085LP64_9BILA|nr:hypothetical protein M513_12341 [Trichuris suis]